VRAKIDMQKITLNFNEAKVFDLRNIKPLVGITGLYFIFLENLEIVYPFKKSRLIYIGMSEKRTNSIGNRLSDHCEGNSGNVGIVNYNKIDKLLFTYFNFEMLKNVWEYRIEDLESYFILDFVKRYGVYPICNNKTGFEVLKNEITTVFEIAWRYFEKSGGDNER
jgi:hypothetical protein